MDHEFELAFNLCDEAAGRIQNQQYGITRIQFHNHGDILLTTVHQHTRETGHHLILLAHDDHGLMAAIEATAAHHEDRPDVRIIKVGVGGLTFHVDPSDRWTYRATRGTDTYTLAAVVPQDIDDPTWTTQFNDAAPVDHDDLELAITELLGTTAHTAAA